MVRNGTFCQNPFWPISNEEETSQTTFPNEEKTTTLDNTYEVLPTSKSENGSSSNAPNLRNFIYFIFLIYIIIYDRYNQLLLKIY